jgi:hypothetical protein
MEKFKFIEEKKADCDLNIISLWCVLEFLYESDPKDENCIMSSSLE